MAEEAAKGAEDVKPEVKPVEKVAVKSVEPVKPGKEKRVPRGVTVNRRQVFTADGKLVDMPENEQPEEVRKPVK